MNKILVTGGAGYIGSHVVKLAGRAGHTLVTLDNLSRGFRNAVVAGELVVGDTGDQAVVSELLHTHSIDTIMHFAAFTIVPESVAEPLKYYHNNTCKTRSLIECAIRAGVKNFIFSSTAAVYGNPASGVCSETSPTAPINPYGQSKLMSEHMLRDACAASDMRHVILRYFNVAGSDPEGEIGQCTPAATLLIKVAAEVAVGKREALYVYGTDYATPDGTGVRDYIHVTDLATAHLQALEYLNAGGASTTFNCGYGHGYSVRQVIETVNRVAGKPIKVIETGRRAGDPPSLIAEAKRIREATGWTPAWDDLESIVTHSLAWERKLAAR